MRQGNEEILYPKKHRRPLPSLLCKSFFYDAGSGGHGLQAGAPDVLAREGGPHHQDGLHEVEVQEQPGNVQCTR